MVNSFTGICLLARVAKVFWTCVMQVQRKFRSDSVHVAPLETAGIFNVEMIPYHGPMSHGTRGRLAWVRWGLGLGGRPCWLSVSLCCISILLRSLSMSGVALSTRLMRALRLRDPVHDLASARAHAWMVGYLCSLFRGSPACYHQLVVILTLLKQGRFFSFLKTLRLCRRDLLTGYNILNW